MTREQEIAALKERIMSRLLDVLEAHETYCLDNELELTALHNKISEVVFSVLDAYLDDR